MSFVPPAAPQAIPSDRIKHLELISNVITRMSTNAFLAKAWSIAVAAALFTAATKTDTRQTALIAIFTSVTLWTLDAYYLSLERQFRDMFMTVAKSSGPADFLMDPSPFNLGRATWRRSLWSPSMLIYLIVATTAALWAATSIWSVSGMQAAAGQGRG